MKLHPPTSAGSNHEWCCHNCGGKCLTKIGFLSFHHFYRRLCHFLCNFDTLHDIYRHLSEKRQNWPKHTQDISGPKQYFSKINTVWTTFLVSICEDTCYMVHMFQHVPGTNVHAFAKRREQKIIIPGTVVKQMFSLYIFAGLIELPKQGGARAPLCGHGGCRWRRVHWCA